MICWLDVGKCRETTNQVWALMSSLLLDGSWCHSECAMKWEKELFVCLVGCLLVFQGRDGEKKVSPGSIGSIYPEYDMLGSYSHLSKCVTGNQLSTSKLKRTFNGKMLILLSLRWSVALWSTVCESEQSEEMLTIKAERDKKGKLKENWTFKWWIKGSRSCVWKRIEVAGY